MAWKHLLPQKQDALRRWRLTLITIGLLMYPLAAEAVTFTINTLRVQAAADFAVCGYPDTGGRFDTKLDGHDLGVRSPTINRHPQTGAVASIAGHIVHIYNNWFDDQYYYVISFQDGTNTVGTYSGWLVSDTPRLSSDSRLPLLENGYSIAGEENGIDGELLVCEAQEEGLPPVSPAILSSYGHIEQDST